MAHFYLDTRMVYKGCFAATKGHFLLGSTLVYHRFVQNILDLLLEGWRRSHKGTTLGSPSR